MRARRSSCRCRRAAGGGALRPDPRDRAGRAPVPRDHPVRCRPTAPPAAPSAAPARRLTAPRCRPRKLHRASTRVLSVAMLLLGVAMSSRRWRAAAGRSPSASCWACCSAARRGRGCSSTLATAASAIERRARRALGSPALFAIVYSTVAQRDLLLARRRRRHALGLTPLVFLVAGLFFALAAMTYVEGASLHQERGGLDRLRALRASTSSWSFVAGWAILLDFVILIAITAFTATQLPRRVLERLGHGTLELVVGARDHRFRRRGATSGRDRAALRSRGILRRGRRHRRCSCC